MNFSNPSIVDGGGLMKRATSSVDSIAKSEAASDARSSRSVTRRPRSTGNARCQSLVVTSPETGCSATSIPGRYGMFSTSVPLPVQRPRVAELARDPTCVVAAAQEPDVRRIARQRRQRARHAPDDVAWIAVERAPDDVLVAGIGAPDDVLVTIVGAPDDVFVTRGAPDDVFITIVGAPDDVFITIVGAPDDVLVAIPGAPDDVLVAIPGAPDDVLVAIPGAPDDVLVTIGAPDNVLVAVGGAPDDV